MPSAIRRHSAASRPPSTAIVMNLVAPSPSRTIACASSTATAVSAPRERARAADRRRARSAPSAPCRSRRSTKLSLVDVSPSTVAQLNDRSAISRVSVAEHVRAAIGASVATNDSIVAMSGWIIPAPLAMPVTVTGMPSTVDPPRRALRHGVGGHDRRHGGEPVVRRSAACAAGSAATIFATGSGSMITPVENGSTCCGAQPSIVATAAQVVSAAAMPGAPVPALALPALTTSARMPARRARGAAGRR